MQAFRPSVLGGRIGGGAVMIDTIMGTPVGHGVQDKLAIIRDKDL